MKPQITLMKHISEKRKSKKSRMTRQNIGEAVLSLMRVRNYEEITVSDIAKKAHVSRMTFYHYFDSKTDALNNYLYEIIESYLEECSRTLGIERFGDAAHVRHALLFLDQYTDFFLILAHANLHSLMLNALNDYMQKYLAPIYPRSIYELYFYAGALLNVFLKWEENGKKEPVEEMVQVILNCCPSQFEKKK